MAMIIEQELLSQVFDGLIAVRSEIFLFCIAFVLHYLLMHKPMKCPKNIATKEKGSSVISNSNEADKEPATFSKDPLQVLERSQAAFDRGDHRSVLKCWSIGGLKTSSVVPAAHLAQIVESMQRFKKDSETILADVSSYLKNSSNASSLSYFNRVLEPLAKSLDMDVVDGLMNLLPTLGQQADARTFEIMIQMQFTTRSFEDISTLSTQMVKQGVSPTQRTRVMLLKSALHTENLDGALCHYRAVATAAEGSPPTASEAPTHIAGQLVELACRLHRPEAVVADLEFGKISLSTEMVNTLLLECGRSGDLDLSSRVQALAQKTSIARDGRTYHVLVQSAGKDRTKISALLDDMAASRTPCTQEVCTAVLAASGQGDTSLADRLYVQLASSSQGQAQALQSLLRFYAENGQPAKACEVFDNHFRGFDKDLQKKLYERRVPLDARTERCLVNAALQCGREDVASAMMESAPSDTAKHISIIRACAQRGNLREAMAAFRSLQAGGAEMAHSLWNTALDACVECRDLEQAMRLMKEIETAGKADAVTYNTLIKAHLRSENLHDARGIMEKMRKAGCAPNHVTYNEVINALVRNATAVARDRVALGPMQAAWDVVEEMKRDGVQPNRITCSILLKSLQANSSNADINRAMDLTNHMTEPMDEVLMSSVVEALVRVGKPALLAQKLSELHRNGSVSVCGAQTFGSLIKAYGRAHDIAGAWQCWKEMRSRHVKPTCVTIGVMVEAVASSGDVDGAYELICQLLEDDQCKEQVNAIVYGSVLKGYSRMKRMARVWAVYNDMLSHGIQPTSSTFNCVLDACARSANMSEVPKLMQDMAKKGIKPNLITYSTIIKGFSQNGDMPAALDALRDLRSTADLKADGIVYNTVLEGCSKAGLIAEGERLFKEIQADGIAPTNYSLTVMVRLMSQTRRSDKAFELVEDLTHKYRFRANSHVRNALIQACLASRDLPRAMSVFEQMSNERQLLDNRTRHTLVRALLAAGSVKEAAVVMRAVVHMTGLPGTQDQQQQNASWGSQDDALLSETLASLSTSGTEGANFAKLLLRELKSSNSKLRINPATERKVLSA